MSVSPPRQTASRSSSRRSMSTSSRSSSESSRSRMLSRTDSLRSMPSQGMCPTCQMQVTHDSNCPFDVDEELLQRSLIQPKILRPPKRRLPSRQILSNLHNVEKVKLCQLQDWCEPNTYPFCFMDRMRIGNQGVPPVISSLTSSKHPETTDALREYLMVERNIVLPKHIILSDEEMGTRLYLGPNSLRPSQTLFSVTEDDTSFTVSLPRNITPGSGSSAAPSEEEGSDDDNQDGDGDDSDDNMLPIEPINPLPSNHQPHEATQLIPNFEPGLDGLGSVDSRQKKMFNIYSVPWKFENQDFLDQINMHKRQFLDIVWKQRGCRTRKSELNIFSETFLWLLKFTKNLANELLRGMFALGSKEHVRQVFIRQNLHYYKHNVNIPNVIGQDGTLNVDERRKIYQLCHDGMSPLHKRLAENLQDPILGLSRICVFINVDGSYEDSEGMSDVEHQKAFFCSHRAGHVVKFINFTTMNGKVIGLLPITTSSMSSGDGFLTSRYVGLLDDQPGENYLRRLLQGDDEYFVACVFDAGFVIKLHNQPREIRDCPNLSQLCDEENAFALHTSPKYEPYILEKDANGKLYKVYDFDPEEKTKIEVTIKFTRLLRMTQESMHGSLKRTFSFLNAKKMPNSYLKPFSASEKRKYDIPDSHKDVPKLSVFIVVGCSLLNEIHPGYKPLYLNEDDQVLMAENILLRMSVENPLLYEDMWPIDFRARARRGDGWTMVRVGRLEYGDDEGAFLGFPTPNEAEFRRAAVFLAGGIHNLLKTNDTLTYIHKLQMQNMEISPEELVQRCEGFPMMMELEYMHIKTPDDFVPTAEMPVWVPPWYDEDKFGDWHDCTIVRSLIPPTMKSATVRANFHHVVIIFGETPTDRLGQGPPYNRVYAWRCFDCPAKTGLLSMDRHCATVLCALSFRHAYRSRARLATVLNAVALECRQGLVILPPSDQSADIPANIPRKGPNTRGNNPWYQGMLHIFQIFFFMLKYFGLGQVPGGGAPPAAPTVAPTAAPTAAPSVAPTVPPTAAPTLPTLPSIAATTVALPAAPTVAPSAAPTGTSQSSSSSVQPVQSAVRPANSQNVSGKNRNVDLS